MLLKVKLRDFDNGSFTLDPIYLVKKQSDIVLTLSSDPSKQHDALTASPGNRINMYTQTFKELINFGGPEFADKYILFFLPTLGLIVGNVI